MEKISYDKIVSSTTMFVVSETLEKKYETKIDLQIRELNENLSLINTKDGLKNYIKEYSNSLENILCLMDISLEKFKRIISLLRIVRGYSVSSEWDLKKTRSCMIENADFMDEVCELLIKGAATKKYQEAIPKFYLESFKINLNVISRLTNDDDLKRLIKSKLETSYNSDIANYYFGLVTDKLTKISQKYGYDIELRVVEKNVKKEVSAIIKHNGKTRIIVDVSYMITTSSSQTDYARKVKSVYELQKRMSAENPNESFLYVIIMDGAGWIGRQSDLQSIYKSCNCFLNLKNLPSFEEIVKEL